MKTIKEIFVCSGLAFATLLILISYQYGCKQKNPLIEEIIVDDQNKKINYNDTLMFAEKMPEYIKGDDSLAKFIYENVKYPQEAIKEEVSGTVFVGFVVNKYGKISNIKILRGIGYGCDEEVIRVVKMLPDFIPGSQDSIPVAVHYNLPVKFNLDSKKK